MSPKNDDIPCSVGSLSGHLGRPDVSLAQLPKIALENLVFLMVVRESLGGVSNCVFFVSSECNF